MKQTNLSTLIIPKQLTFLNSIPICLLKIENPSKDTFVYKIKSNNKTALSISSTHDFVAGLSVKQIPVKLLQAMDNIKLQINYTKATPQMIDKNDSKMTDIDKQYIKKNVVKIITATSTVNTVVSKSNQTKMSDLGSQTAQNNNNFSKSQQYEYQTETIHSSTIHSSTIHSPTKQQHQDSSVFKSYAVQRGKQLETVEQHQDEDLDELEDKRKKLEKDIKQLVVKIGCVNQNIRSQQQLARKKISQLSIVKPWTLFFILIAAFIFGSIIRNALIS